MRGWNQVKVYLSKKGTLVSIYFTVDVTHLRIYLSKDGTQVRMDLK